MKISNTGKSSSEYPLLRAILPTKGKLCLSTMEGQLIINKQEISFVKADNSYCHINYRGKNIFCSQTLKEISSRIHLSNFVRVHRSYIVNMDRLVSINGAFTILTMEDGNEIPISRSQKKLFKSQLSYFFD